MFYWKNCVENRKGGEIMIKTKQELALFLQEDKRANNIKRNRPRFMRDDEWRFLICLRKAEYYSHNWNLLLRFFYYYKYRRMEIKYLTYIPLNICDYGLSIAHLGSIRINGNTKIGKYCRIHEGVTIGASDGNAIAATIGDCVFIGSGARIIGEISIADNSSIAAGAVVVKSITETGTYGGVPAKKISNNDSSKNLAIKEGLIL